MSEAAQWVAAKFQEVSIARPVQPGLVVLANHDAVQKNARAGKPLRLVNTEYNRGLYCHAFSKVVVRLPFPGRVFTAIAGVDSNEQTSGGRGSVDFSVNVGGVEKFRSGLMREGMSGKPVTVELGGAVEFVLQVDETPDGIACDQADWAETKVVLENGRELWLADLPLQEGPQRQPYSTEPPFAFKYDGQESRALLKAWPKQYETRKLDENRTEHTLTWQDAKAGLVVRCLATQYHDFPVVEWTVNLKNTGAADTPVLSELLALDTTIERSGTREFVLHHHKGTFVRADDFEPLATVLPKNQQVRFAPPAGRPLGQVFPYYNLEWSGEGIIVVVGWPGQWAAQFARDNGQAVRVTAGQEQTHFKLRTGEEVRTPLSALMFWKGDWLSSQNLWRRWMLAHNVPRPGGRPLVPQMAACSSHQYGEMINANEANQKMFVDRYLEERLPLDYWWMDAGWYLHYGEGWPKTGTWEVDKARFPNGLRAISDHAHAKNVKIIVWFEPERVTPGTWLAKTHPEWILGGAGGGLLNLGNSAARNWLVEHVSGLLQSEGIDLYRQDYNIDPLSFWRKNDAPDRQGITENHYVMGYLAYWDELLRRHPGLLIDSCASGGHRNDLETMRRSVPLLRSDYIMEPVGQQCHTYGLAFWLPFYGTGTSAMDAYSFRSQMCPHFTACFDMRRRDLPFDQARRLVTEWKTEIAPNYFGDYYPLTPFSTANETWMAWQFDRPEAGKGLVQAFRRRSSVYESARLKLRGLDPEAQYSYVNLDAPELRHARGRELLEQGLLITIPGQPGAAVVTYQKSPVP
jgi:alpha-galactosidase